MARPVALVVMGASGAGKSTVAAALAAANAWPMLDGDDVHPASNVAKMRAGIPLTDTDRAPWLDAIAAWLAGELDAGRSCAAACSALRRTYRDRLRAGVGAAGRVAFLELDAPRDALAARMERRTGHLMPVSLLDSQLATLEPLGDDEDGLRLDATTPLDAIAGRVRAWLAGGDAVAEPGAPDQAEAATSEADEASRTGKPSRR
jgi:carbohydrate kinase (thermoresistant glucokinase family)